MNYPFKVKILDSCVVPHLQENLVQQSGRVLWDLPRVALLHQHGIQSSLLQNHIKHTIREGQSPGVHAQPAELSAVLVSLRHALHTNTGVIHISDGGVAGPVHIIAQSTVATTWERQTESLASEQKFESSITDNLGVTLANKCGCHFQLRPTAFKNC